MNATGRPVLDGWLDTGPSPALLGSRCTECGTVAFPPRRGPCPNPPCLALELTTMATWLGLSTVEVGARGDLAAPLAAVVPHYAHR